MPRKKPTGAACHWAAGGAVTYDVWPEHGPAIDAWLGVSDQWCIGPSGIALGLDWPAVDVLLKLTGVDAGAELIGALQRMEGAAREVLWASTSDGTGSSGPGRAP